MVLGLLGFAGVVLSLLMGLWMRHVRERPVYERPDFLARPLLWRAWTPARWILFLSGGFLLARTSLTAASALALILLVLLSCRRYLASHRHRVRMIRRAFEQERVRDPSADSGKILRRILLSLHPRWGEELVEQIVLDNPTLEGVARMVVRLERGSLPAGFRSSLRRRGRG